MQNDLYIALDLNYINKEDFQVGYNHAQKIAMSINKLITYLKSQIKTYPKTPKINELANQLTN